jgi:outer membrane protein TolC
MLKVTVHDSATALRIRIEGKLTAPWVMELENCWRTAQSGARGKPLLLDLSQVDYADISGKYLLSWMHATGARFVASSLALQEMIEEITGETAPLIPPPRTRMTHRLVGWFLTAISCLPLGAADRPVLHLSLQRAVELAATPEGNVRLQLANESVKQAEARSGQARAALLPNLDASVSQLNQTRNLAALGIGFNSAMAGFEIPTFVGPFNTFDVRASVTQSVFDFASIRRFQSSKAAITGAKAERDSTGDQVAAQVVRAYLAAQKAEADVETAEANIELAKAVLRQVEDQKAAGTGVGIEVTRARVQLSNEQQHLLVVKNGRRRAQLELLRAVGLRLDTRFELDEKLGYPTSEPVSEQDALRKALSSRDDLKAQEERQRSARLSGSATAWERLPSIAAVADYGSIGTSINNALPTRTYGVQVRVPVFDGGRRDARRAESQSQYRQEQTRTRDLREGIELEIRLAIDALRSADEQVQVAREGLKLAEEELASARRRYSAGVATSVEITDAQTRLERARDNNVSALFAYNLARVDLAQSQGVIEEVIR